MVPMQCVGCGANLEIELDMDLFSCAYCGARQQVIAKGGTVSLKPVTEAIRQVQRGTDRMAAELALTRLERELAGNAAAHEAELAKPIATGNNWATLSGTGCIFVSLATILIAWLALQKNSTTQGGVMLLGVGAMFAGIFLVWLGGKFHDALQRERLRNAKQRIDSHFNERAEKISRQISANRATLDAEHSTV